MQNQQKAIDAVAISSGDVQQKSARRIDNAPHSTPSKSLGCGIKAPKHEL